MIKALVVGVLTCALSGCRAGGDGTGDGVDGPGARRVSTSPSSVPGPPPERKWLLEYYDSMGMGLELHRLVDAPVSGRLVSALAEYDDAPLGLSEEVRARLRADGLRLVAVPMADMENVMKKIVHGPIAERTWMGRSPMWQAIATGAPVDGTRMVRAGGQIGAYANGRFRVLMRSYAARLDDPDAPLRIDVTVQFYQPKEDPFSIGAVQASREGMLVPTSSWRMDLDGKYAVILTTDDPARDWSAPVSAGDESSPAPDEGNASTRDERPAARDGTGQVIKDTGARDEADEPPTKVAREGALPQGRDMGPHGPEVRTVGEETMSSADGLTRAVVVFVPRLPGVRVGEARR